MKDSKALVTSITAMSGVILFVLGVFGIVMSPADMTNVAAHIGNIVDAVLGLAVIWGRVRANSKITSVL